MRKTKPKNLSLLFMSIIMLIGCNKDINVKEGEKQNTSKSTTELSFNKEDIPNTPEEFQHAIQLLLANQNYKTNHREAGNNTSNTAVPLPDVPPSTANYNYVRFKPTNEDQMNALTEGGANFELYEEPLHLEDFEFTGDYYEDPAIPADQYPWFYTCVPVGYPMPASIQYEIIQPLFLYNDDPSEPADIEDSWGGEIEEQPENPSSAARISNIRSVTEWMQQNGNPMIQADIWIRKTYPSLKVKQISTISAKYKCPVSPCDPDFYLYANNPLYACTGTCGTGGGSGGCVTNKDSYRPKGDLFVRNTSTNVKNPFKQVKVRCLRVFKLGKAYTTINGHFECNKTYPPNKKVRIIVKFKNPDTKVRAAMSNGRFWQFWFPVRHKFTKMMNCDLETINYTFANDGNAQSSVTRKWGAASYLTAHYDMKNYCMSEGIVPPNKTKVWMTNGSNGLRAFTPMLNYTLNWATGAPKLNALSFSIDLTITSIPFIGPILLVIKKIVELSRPDIMIPISYSGTIYGSEDLYNTIFHELSHAAHYKHMGYQNGWTNASNYWVDNGIYLIGHVNDCGQYGNGYGCKDLSTGQQCTALIEGWAFFAGNTFTSRFFSNNTTSISQTIKQNELRQIEYQTPSNTIDVTGIYAGSTSSTGWIPFGMMYDLTDAYKADDIITNSNNAADYGTDNVSGYSMLQVLKAIPSGTASVQTFKQNLININGNSQQNDITNLVRRYGY